MVDKANYLATIKQLQSEIDFKAIGNHMQSIRLKREMTQATVAEKMNWGTKYYASIEAGKGKISLIRLIQFIVIMQTSADSILKGCHRDYPSPDPNTDSACHERKELNKLLDQCSDEVLKTVLVITKGLLRS